jgi:hypothetical protein
MFRRRNVVPPMTNTNLMHAESNARYRRHPDVSIARSADHLVLMDPDERLFYGVDVLGRQIWDMLGEPRSAEEIVQALAAQYDVAHSTLHADVSAFLSALQGARLVTISWA